MRWWKRTSRGAPSQAFADFYARMFAAEGLLILDAGAREIHRMGSPVLRAALERADELRAALEERNRELERAGYHAQVAVAPQSSLLFLIDTQSGARVALKRIAASATEPQGVWQAGRQKFSTDELAGILAAEPERISPAALLRPLFQDYLLSTSLTIGGPAEVAYFAQSAVLFERILGRMTPVHPRLTATLVEPAIGELLEKHGLACRAGLLGNEGVSGAVACRARHAREAKRKLASAGNALNAELDELLSYMRGLIFRASALS